MRHGTTLIVAAFAALFSAPLQHDPPVAPRRVIGLVEVPRLFGEHGDEELPAPAIMMFHTPDERSSAATTVRGREDVEVREHGYEELSATVYERRAGWFLLRAKQGFAWLSPKDAGPFRSYPHLLHEHLTYLTRDWDRALYDAPGANIARRVETVADTAGPDPDWLWGNKAARPSDATIVELRERDGEWWAHVRIGPSICESDTQPPPVIAEGWVPAYAKSGNPTLWFHSRGC